MSKFLLFAALVSASALLAVSQSEPGSNAVWQIPDGFAAKALAACGSSTTSQKDDCLIKEMEKAGAPDASAAFSRTLLKQRHEDVGVMTSFQQGKPVNIAWVTYPWRQDHKFGLLLLNGQPAIVDIEDLQHLDLKSMRESLQYKTLQKQFPKVDIYPGDRDGRTYPDSQPGANGGAQYVLVYPLRNGCPTCANAGSAMFTWNFDKDGKFLGTSYMGLLPPPLN